MPTFKVSGESLRTLILCLHHLWHKFQFLVLTGVFVLIIIPYMHHQTVSTQTTLLKSPIRQTPLWVDWLTAALL
jgi:hypothetical protein